MKYSIKELITDKISGEWGDESINGGGYKVLRTTNFTNLGKINFENVVERKIDEKKVNQKHLKNGDVIIEKSGGSPTQPVGRVVFFDLNTTEKYLCNNFTAILRPNSDLVYSKYFFYQLYLLHTRGRTLKYQNKTTGIINLKLDNYLNEEIEVPPIPDQLHIANILTKAENLIAKRKESIRLLDEFLKSTFFEMFGDPVRNENVWEIKILGNICGVGSSKRVFVEELVDSGIPFYRGTEIGQMAEGQEITPSLFITEEHYNQLRKHTGIPEIGDLLMPSICSDGRIFRVINNQPFYFKDGRVLWIKVNESKINSIYLQSVLKVIFRTNYDNIASGTTFAELKIVALKQIKIPVAPHALQTQFAQIVEKTETLKAQYKKGLQEMENLYGSLSQRAFRGELSIKDEKLMMAAEPEVKYK